MNETTPNDAVAQRVASLESQVTILLIALVLLAVPVALYFYRQASDARKEFDTVSRVITSYNQNSANINRMVSQLGVFSQTHRDIQPLLEHYNVIPAPGAAAPAAAPRR